MQYEIIVIAALLFFVVAFFYSSIGHGGASGYLAIMAILSFSPEIIKPTALILNIAVSLIASISYIPKGYFDKKVFSSTIITAIPMAYIGGATTLRPDIFKLIAGIYLILSSGLIIFKGFFLKEGGHLKNPPLIYALVIGAIIGFISGLIGIGGGIFLSPIIILAKWTSVKKASGIAALFILANSISGLAGYVSSINHVDTNILYWLIAVVCGGIIGAYLGQNKFSTKIIIAFLTFILISSGFKFILIDYFKLL